MANGYWIGHIDVLNPEGYSSYMPLAAEAISSHGGRFLVRGGESECVEGRLRARHVVVEFPSYQAALDCYRSPAYSAAKKIRQAHSHGEILVVSGPPADS